MSEVAYRFVPCDEDGRPRESSQYTWIRDASEKIEVGSLLEAQHFLGYSRWEVVEIRQDTGGLIQASGKDGTPRSLGGTLVCAVSGDPFLGGHSGTLAQARVLVSTAI